MIHPIRLLMIAFFILLSSYYEKLRIKNPQVLAMPCHAIQIQTSSHLVSHARTDQQVAHESTDQPGCTLYAQTRIEYDAMSHTRLKGFLGSP
jgi:hypothetical protein